MRVAKPIKDERKRIGPRPVMRKSTGDLFRIDVSLFARWDMRAYVFPEDRPGSSKSERLPRT